MDDVAGAADEWRFTIGAEPDGVLYLGTDGESDTDGVQCQPYI